MGHTMMHGTAAHPMGAWSALWRALLTLALIAVCLVPRHVAADPPTPAVSEVGDLDPAVFSLIDALMQSRGAPAPGALRSVAPDGHSLVFQFAGLVVMLPDGNAEAAMVLPLGAALLDRRAAIPLVPGTSVTYGALATGAPRAGAGGAIPALLSAGGALSPLPGGALPAPLAAPGTRLVGGYHVLDAFIDFVTSDRPASSTTATADAGADRAFALTRAGMPVREPVWIRAGGGYLLVQPFTRRVLLWDPLTGGVRATDVGDAALSARLVAGGSAADRLLAAVVGQMLRLPDGVGVAVAYNAPREAFTISVRGNDRFPAASSMKLAILAGCEDAIARGELPRTDDIDALEEAMIVDSDNDAANELLDIVGRKNINALMQRIGMTRSYLGSHFDYAYGDDDDDNYLVPRESLLLIQALVSGDVGDATRIRDLLGRSMAPGSVRDALADAKIAAPVYEKRGWYDGVENDIFTIILGNGGTLTIAIFQPDVSDVSAAWSLFADFTTAIVDAATNP